MIFDAKCEIAQTVPCGHRHNTEMLSGELIEKEAVKARCPTCGAGPGMRCELAIGGPRPQSHLERRLIASDKVKPKLKTC